MDLSLDLFPDLRPPDVAGAVLDLGAAGSTERGAIYTKPEVVDAILDLVGFTSSEPLHARRILEPAFGRGDFLLPIIDRLIEAFRASGGTPSGAIELKGCIRAVEVHEASFNETRSKVIEKLRGHGISATDAVHLTDCWLIHDDFLLAPITSAFDHVVGNPPYVRQERIPFRLLAEYRRRYRTIYDRADLYVPFFERGLSLLDVGGKLGFICANRWLKNRYGCRLREFASRNFRLRYFIDLEKVRAFQSDVIAYPAITVFERGSSGSTRIANPSGLTPESMAHSVALLLGHKSGRAGEVHEVEQAMAHGDPWLLDDPGPTELLRRLERDFPPLESIGCKVGIGVATGADKVFIGRLDELPVEEARKLPLAMAGDLSEGQVAWKGYGVVNPFEEDGTLASFARYPRFAAYMEQHRDILSTRHCARRASSGWYKTIDRITPSLQGRPKLLLPDIKGQPVAAFDEGRFYPHHNLYYIVSDDWDLNALATVLRSSFAAFFVSSYCVRMNGGFLRFQAQYIRRIRVPRWNAISPGQKTLLRDASRCRDLDEIDEAVAGIYHANARDLRMARAALPHAITTMATASHENPSR